TLLNYKRNFVVKFKKRNMEVVELVGVLLTFKTAVQSTFAREKRKKEDHTEQISREFPVLILLFSVL
ncbi:hypothetical protein Tco_1558203, partial [Tanacetum coccineum]